MSEPFVGEIRLFGGNFAPLGWSFCDGLLMAISQNPVLFDLIGTTYGGDGVQTFGLPDLRGRVPIHQGSSREGVNYVMGQVSGSETVTIVSNQVPQHSHPAQAAPGGDVVSPAAAYWSSDPGGNTAAYTGPITNPPSMANTAIGASAGGDAPHENMQPFLVVTYIIALQGVFPSQN
ncbi:MAG TPA: tail fiber protein [Bryobacteraceae bacterium]|nr:tail fiber protein [Bryobacteraceae bacterium]